MRTSFHHQPEAQHPKSPAIETPAGRLPHLRVIHVIAVAGQNRRLSVVVQSRPKWCGTASAAKCQSRTFRDVRFMSALPPTPAELLQCGGQEKSASPFLQIPRSGFRREAGRLALPDDARMFEHIDAVCMR